MNLPLPGADAMVHCQRRYAASPEKLFRAWTQADLLKQWLGGANTEMVDAVLDAQVGGIFQFVFRPPTGDQIVVSGEYQEVQPPQRLVFTWRSGDMLDTLVTVLFHQVEGGTQLELFHERFPSIEVRDNHHAGWVESLNALAGLIQ